MRALAPDGRLLPEKLDRVNAGSAETGRSSRLRKLYESLDSDLRRILRLLRTLDWKESLGRGRLPVEEPAISIVVLYLGWRSRDIQWAGVVLVPVTVRNRWRYRHRCLDFVDRILFSSSSVRFAWCIIESSLPSFPTHRHKCVLSPSLLLLSCLLVK